MLLIANFNPDLPQPQLLNLSSAIAGLLGESEAETFLVSVLPKSGSTTTFPGMQDGAGLLAIKQGLTEPLSVELIFDRATCNFNRVGEELLKAAGLDSFDTEVGWQDSGPVVIFPPSDPLLGVFLSHAIVHYLADGGAWSAFYVVTNLDPLQLQEWD